VLTSLTCDLQHSLKGWQRVCASFKVEISLIWIYFKLILNSQTSLRYHLHSFTLSACRKSLTWRITLLQCWLVFLNRITHDVGVEHNAVKSFCLQHRGRQVCSHVLCSLVKLLSYTHRNSLMSSLKIQNFPKRDIKTYMKPRQQWCKCCTHLLWLRGSWIWRRSSHFDVWSHSYPH